MPPAQAHTASAASSNISIHCFFMADTLHQDVQDKGARYWALHNCNRIETICQDIFTIMPAKPRSASRHGKNRQRPVRGPCRLRKDRVFGCADQRRAAAEKPAERGLLSFIFPASAARLRARRRRRARTSCARWRRSCSRPCRLRTSRPGCTWPAGCLPRRLCGTS